jgi:hypothetical protein
LPKDLIIEELILWEMLKDMKAYTPLRVAAKFGATADRSF